MRFSNERSRRPLVSPAPGESPNHSGGLTWQCREQDSLTVAVPQRLIRRYAIPHELLQLLGLRKPPLLVTREDQLSIHPHFKYSSRAGDQSQLPEFILERGEQLLRHPRGTQQPSTLCAVLNLYPWRHGIMTLQILARALLRCLQRTLSAINVGARRAVTGRCWPTG